jgi:hypothetical protein
MSFFSSPIRLIDPDGMETEDPGKQSKKTVDVKVDKEPVTIKMTNSEVKTSDGHPVAQFVNSIGSGVDEITAVNQTVTTASSNKVVDAKTGNASLVTTTTNTTTTVNLSTKLSDGYEPSSITKTVSTVTMSTPIISQKGDVLTIAPEAGKIIGMTAPVTQTVPSIMNLSKTLQENVNDAISHNKLGLVLGFHDLFHPNKE